MPREFEEHWLSAYLDDELSADERALVTQRLQEDPAARELLEDLKRVRGLVSALPRWQGPEFKLNLDNLTRATVAQAADHQTVENQVAESTDAQPSPAATTGDADYRAIGSQSVNRRAPQDSSSRGSSRYRGALLAIAASLTVFVLAGPYLWRKTIEGNRRSLARNADGVKQPRNAPVLLEQPANSDRDLERDSLEAEQRNAFPKGAESSKDSMFRTNAQPMSERGIPSPAGGMGGGGTGRGGSADFGTTVTDAPLPSARESSDLRLNVERLGDSSGRAMPQSGNRARSVDRPPARSEEYFYEMTTDQTNPTARPPASASKPMSEGSPNIRAASPTLDGLSMSAERTNGPASWDTELLLAYSDGWTADEVTAAMDRVLISLPLDSKQTPPALRRQVEDRGRSVPEVPANEVTKETQRGAVVQERFDRSLGSKIVVANLPDKQTPQTWLTQLQDTHPLKAVPLARANAKAHVDVSDAQGQPADKKMTSDPLATKASKSEQRDDSRGRLVLFLTRPEAQHILTMLHRDSNTSTINDSTPQKSLAGEVAGNDRVVLILNSTP